MGFASMLASYRAVVLRSDRSFYAKGVIAVICLYATVRTKASAQVEHVSFYLCPPSTCPGFILLTASCARGPAAPRPPPPPLLYSLIPMGAL